MYLPGYIKPERVCQACVAQRRSSEPEVSVKKDDFKMLKVSQGRVMIIIYGWLTQY
jgi:hypothetical protein